MTLTTVSTTVPCYTVITYEIRRWRSTKFAKIWALPEGAPKKISTLAIARHGGPPINLFVIPTLAKRYAP